MNKPAVCVAPGMNEAVVASIMGGETSRQREERFLIEEFVPRLQSIGRAFIITVDRSLTLAQMIEAGGYDNEAYAKKDMLDTDFPFQRPSVRQYQKEVFVLPYRLYEKPDGKYDGDFGKRGWTPEEVPELLALGAQHRALQLEHIIVAHGSSQFIGQETTRSPGLWSERGKRRADTDWWVHLRSPKLCVLVSLKGCPFDVRSQTPASTGSLAKGKDMNPALVRKILRAGQ